MTWGSASFSSAPCPQGERLPSKGSFRVFSHQKRHGRVFGLECHPQRAYGHLGDVLIVNLGRRGRLVSDLCRSEDYFVVSLL